jgi:peptidoglycan/LPS O-acetylase OafA/YrhL
VTVNASFLSKLGLLRWLAALVAVTYHVRFLLFAQYTQVRHMGPALTLFYFVTSLGHEALVVYMVASGLLLGGQSWKRWEARLASPWVDLWRKLGRLYMLLVPVLLAGGLLDLAGSTWLDGYRVYSSHPQFAHSHLSLATLAGNLLLLQDILVPGFGSNAMLFLLAYEGWAYLILAVAWAACRRGHRQALVAAAPVALGLALRAPGFIGFFAAWLAGFAVALGGARLQGKVPPRLGIAVFLGCLLVSRVGGSHLPGLPAQFVALARTALDLLVALGLALMLLALYGRQTRRPAAARWTRAQRWLVKLSLPVYAVQFPVMVFMLAGANLRLGLPLHAQPSLPGFMFFAAVVGTVYLFACLVSALVGALQALLSRHSAVLAARYTLH